MLVMFMNYKHVLIHFLKRRATCEVSQNVSTPFCLRDLSKPHLREVESSVVVEWVGEYREKKKALNCFNKKSSQKSVWGTHQSLTNYKASGMILYVFWKLSRVPVHPPVLG